MDGRDVVNIVCADDPDEAFERILPHLAHQLNSYREAGAGRAVRPVTPEMLRAGPAPGRSFQATEVMTPDAVVDRVVADTQGLPVQEVYFWLSLSGMPDETVRRHLELLCGEVRPALQARLAGNTPG